VLLVDTCTFLWWATDDPCVPSAVRERLRNPDETVYLSVVSAWEIAVKYALGKLPLPSPPHDYVPELRKKLLIASLELEEVDVLHATKLPALHRDPFDRMLVAQAIARGFTIVTSDDAVRAYPCMTYWS
jgi:PIN domain nuclease of toxin-antitoxin system